ncbi:ectoine hydroxylase-related dioxygenase (phytanoyl-CoA dioxygenase family) [Paenibacillus taihuensis]|uniref:Ectoine hydroxylase-related dioxygenase (Phytanoyl-CoA dioxygenase family) n=1 Tax=Paenibacillus taihuensis TaxID=1156355 RepID=A0A3D9RIH2_9BACL|nr:phytanoyl-CoA dioxygenase family protein [Paenibacillus taihuensis]REE78912.1 ectoine hydroxylase-related dioxygenase (phytanoyl-CoA dioxygenase family) [Paenibacillus taihuensis]
MGTYYTPKSRDREDRYLVSTDEYTHYHRNGYLIVRGLVSKEDITELYDLAEQTRLKTKPNEDRNNAGDPLNEEFKQQTRIHMLSRLEPAAERGLLHPQIVDVVEALIGPDVLALQSMMFLNPPGRGGQGWHQDACYIKTHPDTLIGAWIALEEVDEENGCLWVVPGSNHEPIYPPDGIGGGNVHALDAFSNLHAVQNVSHLDDEVNTLSRVVAKYPPPISVPMQPGDVLFFHSHLFHRSYANKTADRFRRSYVLHYCNARSWVPWDHDGFEGDSGNYRQILARGRTHLPYAEPQYGTEVYLYEGDEADGESVSMMGMDGMMMPVVQKK